MAPLLLDYIFHNIMDLHFKVQKFGVIAFQIWMWFSSSGFDMNSFGINIPIYIFNLFNKSDEIAQI